MKTWIILRGPDRQRLMEEGDKLAEAIRKGQGTIVLGSAGNIHIDDVQDRSVTVVALQDESYHVHVVDESKTRFMILAIGIDSEANATRLSQGMQELGSVAILSKSGVRTFPEGEKPEECHTVIIDYPSQDTEVRSISFDSEAYFGWLSSKKLSGKRLGV